MLEKLQKISSSPQDISSPWQRFSIRLLRWVYHALYHQLAWTYDLAAWIVSLGRWNNCIRYFANIIKPGRVLELGFGPGHLQNIAADKAISFYGLDASPFMCRKARMNITRRGNSPRLVNGMSQALPYCSASFDQIVASFPAPYIVDPFTLAEVYRVLKPEGELLILLTAWFKGSSLLQKVWARLFKGVLNPGPEPAALSRLFGVQPWKVIIETQTFEENHLLIVTCRKELVE